MSRPTILIIEDNENIREAVGDILEAEGFQVHLAPNGQEGLKYARNSRPSLIFCDIMMPNMDGFAVLSALRSEFELAEIPFIFLSAKAELEDQQRALEFGSHHYLVKPFTREELLEAISKAQIS